MSEATPQPDVSIIVPALNEEDTIQEVIERCLALPLNVQLVVVNDGSTDGTGPILDSFADRITVLTNLSRTGKGAAIRKALPHLLGRATIIQDADLEYSPEQIPDLIQPILEGSASVVYGNRFALGLPASMALPNRIVNRLLALSVRLLFGRPLRDEATCYKAFRTDLLLAMDLQCVRFEFCPEVTAKAIRLGQNIAEMPIAYEARSKAAGKKIRWTDAPEAFWTLLRYRFWRPASKQDDHNAKK